MPNYIGKDLLLLALLYRLRNEGPERFSDLNKTTQLIRTRMVFGEKSSGFKSNVLSLNPCFL